MKIFTEIKLSFLLITGLVLFTNLMSGQISINKDESNPHLSAMLDIQSTEMGFLMPRMTSENRLEIGNPANGLMLFDIDQNQFQYNSGTPSVPNWMPMSQTGDTTLICEKRIPISSIPFTISEPGSYYLTSNLTNTVNFGDGIIIDVDNVTLDLNGFVLSGGTGSSDDGVVILGDQDYIIVKNGFIVDWGGDGVSASNADFSIFENLVSRRNGGDGIVTDFSCLIVECSADSNGQDGLEGDDGSIIINSTASYNGDNGIQTSDGCLIKNCTSNGNLTDGIDVTSGARIENCNVHGNHLNGIDMSLGGTVINCVANYNGYNGIDVSSSNFVANNIANNNGRCAFNGSGCPTGVSTSGVGIRAVFNAIVIGNSAEGNQAGIWISSTDNFVSGNTTLDNSHVGLATTASGSFIESNRSGGNGFSPDATKSGSATPGNFAINGSCAFGPIISVTGLGLINTTTVPGSDHPLANFEF